MDLFKKLRTGAMKAADVAQQTLEITKLTTQIGARRREIEKNKTLIGNEVYAAYQAGDVAKADARVGEICIAIQSLEAEIVRLEHEIRIIRNEKQCACGATLALDAKFCPSCGQPQVNAVAAADIITIEGGAVAEPDRSE